MTPEHDHWLAKEIEALGLRMEKGFARLEEKLDTHAKDDQLVANRVLVIETQRAEEAKQMTRRGTWAGIFAAAVTSAVMGMVSRWLKP